MKTWIISTSKREWRVKATSIQGAFKKAWGKTPPNSLGYLVEAKCQPYDDDHIWYFMPSQGLLWAGHKEEYKQVRRIENGWKAALEGAKNDPIK